jgi:hypothetical protein
MFKYYLDKTSDFKGLSTWYSTSVVKRTSRSALGLTQPPIQMVLEANSLVVKQQRCEADRSPLSIAEVKERRGIPPLLHTSLWRGA